jgi:ribosome biogenesis protein SSF1/2
MFHLLTETVPVSDNQEDSSSSARDGGGEPQKTQERQIVQMRHYAVKRTPVGVNRKVRRIVERKKKLPNLHKVNDIADYVSGNAVVSDGAPSDSEFEDNLDDDGDDKQGEGGGEGDDRSAASSSHQSSTGGSAAAVVEVATGGGRMQKSAIKLVEIGPRLSLELFKVEKGLGGGNDKNNEDVLYHAHVQKTPAEVAEIRQRQRDEAARKEERRATQDANVQRKRKALEEKREQKRQRKEEKQQAAMQALREGRPIEQEQEAAADDDDDDDGSRDNDGSDEDSEAS